MKIFAETKRIILREVILEDVDGFFEMDSDLEVHKFLGKQPVTSKDQIIPVIHFIRKQYVDNGIGRWAMVEKNTNTFIGWCGLKLVTEPIHHHINFYDLGYRLIRKYWGQGFATEAGIASLEYAFYVLKLKQVCAIVDINNLVSVHLLKKLGFRCMDTFTLDDAVHHWLELNALDFRNRKYTSD